MVLPPVAAVVFAYGEWYVARGDVVLPLARQWYSAVGRVVCRPWRRGIAAGAAVVFCHGQSDISCGARSGMPLARRWYSAAGRVVWLRRGFAPGNAPRLPCATVFYAFAAADCRREFENCSQFRPAMIARKSPPVKPTARKTPFLFIIISPVSVCLPRHRSPFHLSVALVCPSLPAVALAPRAAFFVPPRRSMFPRLTSPTGFPCQPWVFPIGRGKAFVFLIRFRFSEFRLREVRHF